MPDEYSVKFHPEFFKDLDKLDKRELETINKQIKKIESSPARFKRLHGRGNCHSVRIGNLRIVYYLIKKTIWFLVVERRKTVYSVYFKRLYMIKQKLE